MIFFWDRNIPKSIPEAIRTLNPPFENKIHREHFPHFDHVPESGDENWLSLLGEHEWFLLTKDHRLHHRVNEVQAIKQYRVGCFYLWGRNAKKWDIAQCFMAAVPAIVKAAEATPRPFVFRVSRLGQLSSVPIP